MRKSAKKYKLYEFKTTSIDPTQSTIQSIVLPDQTTYKYFEQYTKKTHNLYYYVTKTTAPPYTMLFRKLCIKI